MKTREFKSDCILDVKGHKLPGVAHVIEVEKCRNYTWLDSNQQPSVP